MVRLIVGCLYLTILLSGCVSTGKGSTKAQCQTGSKTTLVNECVRIRLPDM